MAAKGTKAKKQIIETILNTFEGSFLYNGDKEIRIPMHEDGAEIQIKVTLSCAATNVSPEGEAAAATTTNQDTTMNEGDIKIAKKALETFNFI
jgi:RAB protein geranylgeranyltransferase component A